MRRLIVSLYLFFCFKKKEKVNANLQGTVDTTGTKAVGNGLQGLTGGVKDGADALGKGAENAGQWK